MNFNKSVLLLLFIVLSCNKNKHIEPKPLKIYNAQDFKNKAKVIDTVCINDEKRAKEDIRRGKLYYNITSYRPYDYTKLVQKFAPLNIIPDTTSRENMRDSKGYLMYFHKRCYQSAMQDYILEKHSTSALDSIVETVERQYIVDHPAYIASMRDIDSEYGNEGTVAFHNILDRIQLKFKFDFIFPKGYKSDNKKTSKSIATFILLKNGTIKNLNVESTFHNNSNAEYSKYFKDYISHLIQNEKWLPAYSVDLPVNAKIEIEFKHK